MLQRSAFPYVILIAFLVVLQSRAALAGDCLITGPRYQLRSDSIEWQMKTRIGQSCIRGIRFSNVASPVIKIISPPRFGELTLLGPSFSYKAGTDFRNEDLFVIEVSGSIGRVAGTSTIRVAISSFDAPKAQALEQPPIQDVRPSPQPVPEATGQAVPLPGDIVPATATSLPPCPTWDWAKGSPPPMRPPFDRSKLYCPPQPFHPPNAPIGCSCAK